MTNEELFFNSINNLSQNEINNQDVNNFFKSAMIILENASKKNRIKDNFKGLYYQPNITLSCFLTSEKTKSEYHLMYDCYKNEIIFYSSIHNWENIKNLSDSFWLEFLEISNKYNFKFGSYSGPFYDKEKTPEFNANYKSLLFNLMNVYITAMLNSKEDRQNISFGQLEVVWTAEHQTEDIIEQLNVAFKLFYQFNYLLWKSEDIRKQNKNNRNKKK